jgi:hypothetical protein
MEQYTLSELENLPLDILFVLLDNLTPKKILELCQLSKRLNDVICKSDPRGLWRKWYVRDLSDKVPKDYFSRYRTTMMYIKNKSEEEALTYAIENGYSKLVLEILTKSKNMSLRYQAIDQATKLGQLEIVQQIINTFPIDIEYVLNIAAKYGPLQWVDFLYKQQIQNNFNSKRLETIINNAFAYAAQGGSQDIISYFLNLGANRYDLGLRRAVLGKDRKLDNISIVNKMLELGADDLEQASVNAALDGNIELLDYLLKNNPILVDYEYLIQRLKDYLKTETRLNRITLIENYIDFLQSNPQFNFLNVSN